MKKGKWLRVPFSEMQFSMADAEEMLRMQAQKQYPSCDIKVVVSIRLRPFARQRQRKAKV